MYSPKYAELLKGVAVFAGVRVIVFNGAQSALRKTKGMLKRTKSSLQSILDVVQRSTTHSTDYAGCAHKNIVLYGIHRVCSEDPRVLYGVWRV